MQHSIATHHVASVISDPWPWTNRNWVVSQKCFWANLSCRGCLETLVHLRLELGWQTYIGIVRLKVCWEGDYLLTVADIVKKLLKSYLARYLLICTKMAGQVLRMTPVWLCMQLKGRDIWYHVTGCFWSRDPVINRGVALCSLFACHTPCPNEVTHDLWLP